MAERPLIGVTASTRGSFRMTTLNRLALWRAGARSVVLQPDRRAELAGLDALVIGGGDDIGANLYGGEIRLKVRTDPERDRLELVALEHAEKRGLPVLGICRGAQMINIQRGGSLHHDVYERYQGVPRGRTVLAVRQVWLEEGTRGRAILGSETTRVNVLHHQSVDRLGAGLRINARDRYGIVQGIEAVNAAQARLLIGVQWHPEFMPFHKRQQRLFSTLVASIAACRGVGS